MRVLHYLDKGYNLVNIDESLVSGLYYKPKAWYYKKSPNTAAVKTPFTPTAIVATITSEGDSYAMLHQGSTNSNTTIYFFKSVIEKLREKDPSRLSKTIFMIDNAGYHSNKVVFDWMRA